MVFGHKGLERSAPRGLLSSCHTWVRFPLGSLIPLTPLTREITQSDRKAPQEEFPE